MTPPPFDYGEFLRELVTHFVSYPDEVKVKTARKRNGTFFLNASCHATDISKLIGQGGSTVKALRVILEFKGRQNGHRIAFWIDEPTVGEKEPETRFTPAENWTEEDDKALAEDLIKLVGLIVNNDTFSLHWEPTAASTRFWFANDIIPLPLQYALNTIFVATSHCRGRRVTLSMAETAVRP